MLFHEDDRKRLERKVLDPENKCIPKKPFVKDRKKGGC